MNLRILCLFILLNIPFIIFSQDLRDAKFKYLCSNQSVIGESPQYSGFHTLKANCNFTTYLTPRLDFYLMRIKSGTTFTFTLKPKLNIDYDFVSWLNPNLENVGLGDRGSSNNPHSLGIYSIGLSMESEIFCDESGASSDGNVRYYDVKPGDVILIALDRWEEIDSGYEISFGGDAILDCSFNGNEYYGCETNGSTTFFLSDYIQNTLAKYIANYSILTYENKEDAIQASSKVFNSSEIKLTLENPEKKIYFLIRDENNVLVKIEEYTFRITEKIDFKPQNIEVCDFLSFQNIDLTRSIPAEILANTNFEFKFYHSLEDAEKNENSIENFKEYNGEFGEIFIRSQHILNADCFTIQKFELVNQISPIESLNQIKVCQQQANLFWIDLAKIKEENDFLKDIKILYYRSKEDLISNQNEIKEIDTFLASDLKGEIFIRVEKGNCPDFYRFEFEIMPITQVLNKEELTVCNGSEYILDLSTYKDKIEILGDHEMLGRNVFRITRAGSYQLDVTNEFGCKSTFDFEVKFYPFPKVNSLEITNDVVTFKVNEENSEMTYSLDQINWTKAKDLKLPNHQTTHTIFAKFNNCIAELIQFKSLKINSIITPNGDGINDEWVIDFYNGNINYKASIFDRTGKKLKDFTNTNPLIWNGKSNGRILVSDTYWYVIEYMQPAIDFDIPVRYTGSILLKNK